MVRFFDNWDEHKKWVVILIIILLLVALIIGIIYHFNYRNDCVPVDKLNKCTSSLNLTNQKLTTKEDENILLKSRLDELNGSSSQCSDDLKQCRKDFAELNESYQKLLAKFDLLNETYQKLLLEKQICPEKEINETAKLDQQKANRGEHFEYSFIALIIVLSISLPIKVGLKDELANRVMNFFVGTFIASMLVLGYIPYSNFWIKLLIAVILGIIVAIFVYKTSRNNL